MSSNATSPGATSPPTAPSAASILHSQLTSAMITHTFLMLLFPLLIALFYFSTPQSRRRPIFILNVLAIVFGITAGTLIDAYSVHNMLSPLDPWPPSVDIAIGTIGSFQSMFVDFTLLVRLISVHPLSHVGLRRFALLTTLPILLKIARLINLIIFIKVLAVASRGPLGAQNMAIAWATTPYLKIEWTAQMVDNAYVSIVFLWTIRDRKKNTGVTSDIQPNKMTFGQRLRVLSRIALSNFIIPTLFSIAQLIIVYRNVSVLIVNQIILVNSMLAVFGVVFATVWAGKVHRREAEVALWEESSRTEDEEKKPTPAYAFPGLGTWRVASPSAGTPWLRSVAYEEGLGEGAGSGSSSSGAGFRSEKDKPDRGVLVVHDGHSAGLPTDSLEGAWIREGVVRMSGGLAPVRHSRDVAQ